MFKLIFLTKMSEDSEHKYHFSRGMAVVFHKPQLTLRSSSPLMDTTTHTVIQHMQKQLHHFVYVSVRLCCRKL